MCSCTKPLCLAAFGLGVVVASSGPIASRIGWSDGSPVDAVGAVARADDPISGEWEGMISGEAFPEDVNLVVTLEMNDEGEVTGTFTIPDGEAPFEGKFDAETSILTGAVTTDDGQNWETYLTLDEEQNELDGDATETSSGTTADISLGRSDE